MWQRLTSEALVIAPLLMLFTVEILHSLIVDQRVGGSGACLGVGLVHSLPKSRAPLPGRAQTSH